MCLPGGSASTLCSRQRRLACPLTSKSMGRRSSDGCRWVGGHTQANSHAHTNTHAHTHTCTHTHEPTLLACACFPQVVPALHKPKSAGSANPVLCFSQVSARLQRFEVSRMFAAMLQLINNRCAVCTPCWTAREGGRGERGCCEMGRLGKKGVWPWKRGRGGLTEWTWGLGWVPRITDRILVY